MSFASTRLLLAIPALVLAARHAPAEGGAAGSWDLAWEVASGIANDPHDRLRAQAEVLMDLLGEGELEVVRERVVALDGWRRGEVWAAVARLLVDRGDLAGAAAILPEIEGAAGEGTPDWAATRLATAADEIRRRLGQPVADRDGNPFETHGEQAARLLARARVELDAGEAATAAGTLREALLVFDIEAAPALIALFLRASSLPSVADLAEGLRADAVRVVRALPPERLSPVLEAVARAVPADVLGGFLDEVGVTLDAAASAVAGQAPHYAAEVLSGIAGVAFAMDRLDEGRGHLAAAAAAARRCDPWEAPRIIALVARAAGGDAGSRATGLALVGEGLAGLAAVDNPRPRALALTDLCRALARLGGDEALLARARAEADAVAALFEARRSSRPLVVEVIRPATP